MAVPKRRTTSAKRNQRRANHDKIALPNADVCPNCGETKLRHRACGACGHYKGREVFEVKSVEEEVIAEEDEETESED